MCRVRILATYVVEHTLVANPYLAPRTAGSYRAQLQHTTGGRAKSPRAPDFHLTAEKYTLNYFITPLRHICAHHAKVLMKAKYICSGPVFWGLIFHEIQDVPSSPSSKHKKKRIGDLPNKNH